MNGTYLLQLTPGPWPTCVWSYTFASPVCGYFTISVQFSAIGGLLLQIAANVPGSGWTLQWQKNMTWPVDHCQAISICPANGKSSFSANDMQSCGWPEVRYDHMCHWDAAMVSLAAV